MRDGFFAISDIHGCDHKLTELLQHWNSDNEQLILLGDYVDRGPNSFNVLQKVMKLQRLYGAVALKGNHEDLFLSFLDSPETEGQFYFSQGGRETILSFIDAFQEPRYELPIIAKKIEKEYSELVQWVREMPNYYEHNHHVFVHAGADLSLDDWRQTSDLDFRWIRDPFHHGQNLTGKIFVFGHTPTRMLNKDQTNDIWFSSCRTKIGIDGGACFNGQLNAISGGVGYGYQMYSV